MFDEIDLSGVATSDVAQVLSQAADFIERKAGERVPALVAITIACDAVGGPGVGSAELHMASLDAVCLDVFGRRHGHDASVSRWERAANRTEVITTLRRLAAAVPVTS